MGDSANSQAASINLTGAGATVPNSALIPATTAATPKPADPGPNTLAMGLTAAGGLNSAVGQYLAGKTNEQISRDNASIAESKAEEATNAGAFAAAKAQERGRAVAAQARAAQAGGGVVAGAGTGALVAEDSQKASAMDALMIERNAARESLGFQNQAAADQEQAIASGQQAKAGAISTLLNTGSQEWLESDPNYGGFRGRGISFGN